MFFIPPCIRRPRCGVPVGIVPWRFVRKNQNCLATRWWKNLEDMFIRFHTIHERDGRTDRHTHRETDTAWRHRPRLYMRSITRQKRFISWQLGHTVETIWKTIHTIFNIPTFYFNMCTCICTMIRTHLQLIGWSMIVWSTLYFWFVIISMSNRVNWILLLWNRSQSIFFSRLTETLSKCVCRVPS